MRNVVFFALVVGLGGCTNFSALSRDYGDLGDDAAAPTFDLAIDDGARRPVTDLLGDGDVTPDCTDGVQDGDETDVDCGGSCSPCDVGLMCAVDDDCMTGACIASSCELASGPPAWLPVGSPPTGNNAPTARYDLEMALGSDNALYAVGGRDSFNGATTTVERLDTSGAWTTPNGNLAQKRASFAMTSSGGTMFAIDGDNGTNNNGLVFQSSVEKSAMGDNFATVNGLGDNRTGCAGTVDSTGRIYFYGGFDGTNYLVSGNSFGTSDTSYTAMGMLTTGRASHGAALGSDGRLYAIGGTDATGTLSSVEAYTTGTSTWATVASLPMPRTSVPAATGPDGRIYVAGGYDPEGGTVYSSVVAYRASTARVADRWVPVASLAGPRYRHAVATGADGRIYVAAGLSLLGSLRTTEAYGPVVALGASSGAAGSTVTVSGSNFATNAPVSITLGATVLGTSTTDASGNIAAVSVMIPAGTASGTVRIVATDSRSRYPVSAAFTVM